MQQIVIAVLSIISIPITLLLIIGLYYLCQKVFLMICKFIKQEHINHLEYRLEQLSRQREVKADILRARKDIYYLDKSVKPTKTKGDFWKQIYHWANEHYIATAFMASIVVAILFVSIMLLYNRMQCHCCLEFYVTDKERIVLSFVGILATFIVLTNHAQTTEATRRVEKQLKNNKELINDVVSKIDQEQEKITNKTSKLAHDTFMQSISFVNACQERETLECARQIVSKYMQNPNATFNIEYVTEQRKNEDLLLTRRETKIFFRDTTDSYCISPSFKDIRTIDGMKYNHDYLETIVFNLMLLKDNFNR